MLEQYKYDCFSMKKSILDEYKEHCASGLTPAEVAELAEEKEELAAKVRNFFENETESWGKEDIIADIISECLPKEVKYIPADELHIRQDEDYIIDLQEFVQKIFDDITSGILNVIDSFAKEEAQQALERSKPE